MLIEKMKDAKQVNKDIREAMRVCIALSAFLLLTPILTAAAPHDFDGDGKTDFMVVRNTYFSPCQNPSATFPIVCTAPKLEQSTYFMRSSTTGGVGVLSRIGPTEVVGTYTVRDHATTNEQGLPKRLAMESFYFGPDSPFVGVEEFYRNADGAVRATDVPRYRFAPRFTIEQLAEHSFGESEDIFASVATVLHSNYGGEFYSNLPVWRIEKNSEQRLVFAVSQFHDDSVTLDKIIFQPGTPVVADYDGDGVDDLAVLSFRDKIWTIRNSDTGVDARYQWGLPGDIAMPGDYDGDGKADLAVWRPSNAVWYISTSSSNYDPAQAVITQFGLPRSTSPGLYFPDLPIQADFDGDGKLDLAVWRQITGTWYYKHSSDGAILSQQWGLPGDIAVGTALGVRLDH